MARRMLSAALTTVAVLAGLVVAEAPAQAIHSETAPQVKRAYTDLRDPHGLAVNVPGPVPVGMWRDGQGQYHASRAYFTYDISRFRGAVIRDAGFYTTETSVTDCSKAAVVEVWITDEPTSASSWLNPPTQRQLITSSTRGEPGHCPWGLEAHLTEAVVQTLAAGHDRITLSLRIKGVKELDPRLSRWFRDSSFLSIEFNNIPRVPDELSPCDVAIGPSAISFRAVSGDVDEDRLTGTIAIWPEADPSQRRELPGVMRDRDGVLTYLWYHDLADGKYAWSVRAQDEDDASAWSAPCTFTIDTTPPAAPAVSSVDYPSDGQPHGGSGVPGQFTFTGPADAVAYKYGISSLGQTVQASGPGQPVTVEVAPRGGPNTLYVATLDAAGNQSALTQYEFKVNSTEPSVEFGEVRGVGYPVSITITPGVPGVIKYGYRVGDGPETLVDAMPDGTGAGTVVFTHPGYPVVTVRSWTASGLAGVGSTSALVVDNPRTSWDGSALTFQPRRASTVAYRYAISGYEVQTVQADSAGVATVPLSLPDGLYQVDVVSVDADGTVSVGADSFTFSVRSSAGGPTVTSDVYGNSPEPAGGVGVAGQFSFATGLIAEVEGFVFTLNGGPDQFTWAGFEGDGQVTLSPDRTGTNTLVVRARFFDGTLSAPTTFTFEVA